MPFFTQENEILYGTQTTKLINDHSFSEFRE